MFDKILNNQVLLNEISYWFLKSIKLFTRWNIPIVKWLADSKWGYILQTLFKKVHLNGKESTVNRALGGSTYPG